jgi:hypothetical protein
VILHNIKDQLMKSAKGRCNLGDPRGPLGIPFELYLDILDERAIIVSPSFPFLPRALVDFLVKTDEKPHTWTS